MWILFSPSEKKCLKHKCEVEFQEDFYENLLAKDTLQEVLKSYQSFLQKESEEKIKKLFGKKKLDLESLSACQNLFNTPLLSAILRYGGVAYEALDFQSLSKNAQEYLYEKVLIFSNLFLLLRASDKIPYYDLMQGEKFYNFDTKKFYKQNEGIFKNFLGDENEILDLRAGFYQKCLEFDEKYTILEPIFIKGGKVVSHYAKHYRGILLRECAKEKIECLAHFEDLEIKGLKKLRKESTQEKKGARKIQLFYDVL